jgi:hypothetical protein
MSNRNSSLSIMPSSSFLSHVLRSVLLTRASAPDSVRGAERFLNSTAMRADYCVTLLQIQWRHGELRGNLSKGLLRRSPKAPLDPADVRIAHVQRGKFALRHSAFCSEPSNPLADCFVHCELPPISRIDESRDLRSRLVTFAGRPIAGGRRLDRRSRPSPGHCPGVS